MELVLEKMVRGLKKHKDLGDRFFEELSKGQDPSIFAITCSDSRIDSRSIFGVKPQGDVFEVRNVAGLVTKDAIAAATYVLRHLDPKVILILHHTQCGGYKTLFKEGVEKEIKEHMVNNEGEVARDKVVSYKRSENLQLTKEQIERLTIEEGARVQRDRLLEFLEKNYPEICEKINDSIKLITAVYALETGDVYQVPERLEGSESMERESL